MLTRTLLYISILFACLATDVLAADDPAINNQKIEEEKLAELERMFVLKNLPKSVESLSVQLMEVFHDLSAYTRISEQDKVVLEKEVALLLKQEFAWEKVEAQLLNLYSESFSLGELKQINAFYESPAGKKWLLQAPVIDEKLSLLSNQRMSQIVPKIQALADEFIITPH